jgi:methanethiol S-methyltransferase
MKKTIFLLYGIAVYIIFIGTFCYTIGFVSTWFFMKHIDSKPESSLAHALFVNAGLLSLFGLQHSIMARSAFKRWSAQFLPEPLERSTYVLFTSLCLILLFWKWEPIGGKIWIVEVESLQIFLKALSMLGFAIVLITTFLINHFDLFGLRQVWLYFRGEKYGHIPFRTPLFYKYVRHPLYLGFLIAFWSTPTMTAAHFFFAVMTTGYILLATQFEENDMVKHFGGLYQEYKRSTPMLIPFIRGKKKKSRYRKIS